MQRQVQDANVVLVLVLDDPLDARDRSRQGGAPGVVGDLYVDEVRVRSDPDVAAAQEVAVAPGDAGHVRTMAIAVVGIGRTADRDLRHKAAVIVVVIGREIGMLVIGNSRVHHGDADALPRNTVIPGPWRVHRERVCRSERARLNEAGGDHRRVQAHPLDAIGSGDGAKRRGRQVRLDQRRHCEAPLDGAAGVADSLLDSVCVCRNLD